ncbi:MAG: FmdB family zinc ribbon protein [Spirochaetales bacterium]
MPSYDYECTVCGHRFELFQNMSDPPVTDCPQCGKRVRRLIGGGMGVIFKGSGFYVTDNRKSSSSSTSTSDKKGSTETSQKIESQKTESTAKEKVAV